MVLLELPGPCPVQTARSIPKGCVVRFSCCLFLAIDGGRKQEALPEVAFLRECWDPGYVMGRKDRAFFFPAAVTRPGFLLIFRRASMVLLKACWEQGTQRDH